MSLRNLCIFLCLITTLGCSGSKSANNTVDSCEKLSKATPNKFFNDAKVATCYGDRNSARMLYEKSCSSKFAKGCAILGYLQAKEKNYSKARRSYSQGCDLGDANSCYNLKNIPTKQSRYYNRAYVTLNRAGDKIVACYRVHNNEKAIRSRIQADNRMQLVNYSVTILSDGKTTNQKVDSKLGTKFTKCAIEALARLRFQRPPRGLIPTLNQKLTLHREQ